MRVLLCMCVSLDTSVCIHVCVQGGVCPPVPWPCSELEVQACGCGPRCTGPRCACTRCPSFPTRLIPHMCEASSGTATTWSPNTTAKCEWCRPGSVRRPPRGEGSDSPHPAPCIGCIQDQASPGKPTAGTSPPLGIFRAASLHPSCSMLGSPSPRALPPLPLPPLLHETIQLLA